MTFVKIFQTFLLCCLLHLSSSAAEQKGKYRVYLVTPETDDDVYLLRRIAENYSTEDADFWQMPQVVNESVRVLAGPGSHLPRLLETNSLQYSLDDSDFSKTLIDSSMLFKRRAALMEGGRLKDDISVPFGALPQAAYHSHGAISESLRRMAEASGGLAQVVDIGRSVEGRAIVGLKIGRDDGRKNVVVFDAGIHAREWATVHTALYFINQLLNPSPTSEVREILDRLVVYVFPVLNPDGYEYTRIDETHPKYRMWRKNRGRELCTDFNGQRRCCKGVDLNRNFDFQFGVAGSSRYVCSEIYHGPNAFSEPETRAVRDFFYSMRQRVRAYITLHAYSQLFIHSFSHRTNAYPREIDDIRSAAAEAVRRLESVYGTKYRFGTGPEIIYGFGGGSTDWATQYANVKYSYTIELRPLYTAPNGFVMRPSELIPTARETWRGVSAILERVLREQPKTRGFG